MAWTTTAKVEAALVAAGPEGLTTVALYAALTGEQPLSRDYARNRLRNYVERLQRQGKVYLLGATKCARYLHRSHLPANLIPDLQAQLQDRGAQVPDYDALLEAHPELALAITTAANPGHAELVARLTVTLAKAWRAP